MPAGRNANENHKIVIRLCHGIENFPRGADCIHMKVSRCSGCGHYLKHFFSTSNYFQKQSYLRVASEYAHHWRSFPSRSICTFSTIHTLLYTEHKKRVPSACALHITEVEALSSHMSREYGDCGVIVEKLGAVHKFQYIREMMNEICFCRMKWCHDS